MDGNVLGLWRDVFHGSQIPMKLKYSIKAFWKQMTVPFLKIWAEIGDFLLSCLKLLHFAGIQGFDPLHFPKNRYDLLIAHKEELGQLITLEQGKPLKEAIGEVYDSIYI